MFNVNPFEKDSQFVYDKGIAIDNHGGDVLIHLSVGQGDHGSLDTILDHNPSFEDWLIDSGREAEMALDNTIGLAWEEDNSPFSGSMCVVISKLKT